MEANASGKKTGLPPVVDPGCRLLILGSMPGEASLQAQQYYGHPRNAFWPLLYGLLDGGEPSGIYAERLQFALGRGVALWDVLRECEREGSLDAAIRKAEANDFRAFFAAYPGITHVFFNGSAAAQYFRRQAAPQVEGLPLHYAVLPSSSPARAMGLEAKREGWLPVREAWLVSRQG
ncbi:MULTISPECIES: DNA-deoxyinosine glycosylase [Paenibacillus]|uniref:DNA-deoxyinosine glycosylase n=1 Tax=Paenibacillus TaxID=44249 RepID=UPI0022B93107|nr:DNA-deoxyinosine glycosylase [Paenibacillus caseinilyticus]